MTTQIHQYRLDDLAKTAGLHAAAVYIGPDCQEIRRKEGRGVTDELEQLIWGAAELLQRTKYPEMRVTVGKDLTAKTILARTINGTVVVVLFDTGDAVAKSVKRTVLRCANLRFANKASKGAMASATPRPGRRRPAKPWPAKPSARPTPTRAESTRSTMPAATYEQPDAEMLELLSTAVETYHPRLLDADVHVMLLVAHGPTDADGEVVGPAIQHHGIAALGITKTASGTSRSWSTATLGRTCPTPNASRCSTTSSRTWRSSTRSAHAS
jgi:hypothetical protein